MGGSSKRREVAAPRDRGRALAIIRHLRRRGVAHIDALERDLRIPRTTLYADFKPLRMGEPPILDTQKAGWFQLHADLGYVVGVDITHAEATIAVAGLDYRPRGAKSISGFDIENPDQTLDVIAQAVVDVLEDALGPELVAERLIGIGLSLPAPVLRRRNPDSQRKEASEWDRLVEAGSILPGWDDVDAASELARRLTEAPRQLLVPRHGERRFVWVENDGSAGALGVHTEVQANTELARDRRIASDDMLYVRLSTGIGAGIIQKGHLVTGPRGFAGELGHVRLASGGVLCPACGGRGCLETVASNRAVLKQLEDVVPLSGPSVATSLVAVGAGSPGGQRVDDRLKQLLDLGPPHPAVDQTLWDAGWHVGKALAHACCLLNPSLIVLDGLMAEHRSETSDELEPRPFVRAVRHAIDRHTIAQARAPITTWHDQRRHDLSPQQLGSLALVVDHLGDGYLLKPIERWLIDPGMPLSFSNSTSGT